MREKQIDAWLIFSADPHLSEYLPDYWKIRERLSGFTGSAGTLLLLQNEAHLWTDSRYWVQAEEELKNSSITLQKQGAEGVLSYTQFLCQTLPKGATVGLLKETISIADYTQLNKQLTQKGITLTTQAPPAELLFAKASPLPKSPLYQHAPQFTPHSAKEKIDRVRQTMAQQGTLYHLISSLDDIAWLTNLRGSDVAYNPLFLSFLLLTPKMGVLFIDETKVSPSIRTKLDAIGITLKPYTALADELSRLKPGTIWLDPNRTTAATLATLPTQVTPHFQLNPSTLFKAEKSPQEIEHIRDAMVEDGVAFTYFLYRFAEAQQKGERISELTIAKMLEEERRKRAHFISLSFGTIAGFNQNGALPHYAATKSSYSYIEGDGLLLIDSGAQYQNGTTDLTRVLPVGNPSQAQKRDYTRVLKGLINLSRTPFPPTVTLAHLDSLARAPLWQAGLDFGHGTGHGVGYFLNVHEGPHILSYRATTAEENIARPGLISSIEPGLYREERWGVRIENLGVILPYKTEESEFGPFLHFETLTLAPIDRSLILPALLNHEEVEWLNQYHSKVYHKLAPKIDDSAVKKWLKEATQPL